MKKEKIEITIDHLTVVKELKQAGDTAANLEGISKRALIYRALLENLTKNEFPTSVYEVEILNRNDIFNTSKSKINIAAAILNGDAKVIDQYFAEGGDVNVRNEEGNTLLHLACRNGIVWVFELLLQKGADINAKNNDGETVFWIAQIYGNKEIVEILANRKK